MSEAAGKQQWRFMWSHEAAFHRFAMRVFNRVAKLMPFWLKYGIGRRVRANQYPYRLVNSGSTVVQVGAPRDTLMSGRSRAMHFTLLARNGGRVFVVEPDEQSVDTFRRVAKDQGLDHTHVFPFAAWSEQKRLTIYVDDAHPAANFSEGSKEYDEKRMDDYRAVELPADSLDNLLSGQDVSQVDLVSITTNGAEREILEGMRGLMAAGLPHICLAITGENYVEMMSEFGYELVAHDDRGFTFKQKRQLT